MLRADGGEARDAPAEEAGEVETALFLLDAPDLDAATDLARACPALLHGETVLVRPLGSAA